MIFWNESSATEPGGTARDGRAQEPGAANIPAMAIAGIAPGEKVDGLDRPMPMNGAYTLADVAARASMLDIPRRGCDRRGRLNVARLIEAHGPDAPLPDLKAALAMQLRLLSAPVRPVRPSRTGYRKTRATRCSCSRPVEPATHGRSFQSEWPV